MPIITQSTTASPPIPFWEVFHMAANTPITAPVPIFEDNEIERAFFTLLNSILVESFLLITLKNFFSFIIYI